MKRKALIAFAALAAAFLILASCAPTMGDGENKLGGTEAQELTILTEGNTHIDSSVSTTALAYSEDWDTLYNTSEQVIRIYLNYPLDMATVTGVHVYALGNNVLATDVNVLSTRSAEKTITSSTLLRDYANPAYPYVLKLVVDLSSATEVCELFLDAQVLTGETNQRLDGDADGIQGEINDSSFIQLPVSQSTATGSSAPLAVDYPTLRVPVAGLGYAALDFLAANANISRTTLNSGAGFYLGFTLADSGYSATATNKVSWAGAVLTYRWDAATASWLSVPNSSNPLDNTTSLETHIAFDTAPAYNDSFKVVIDRYNLVETLPVLGFAHRDYEDADGPARYITRYYYFHDSVMPQQAFSSFGKGGENYEKYIDFYVAAGVPINLATVNAQNLRIKLGQGTVLSNGTTLLAGQYVYAQYTAADVVSMGNYTWTTFNNCVRWFRVYLPSSIKSLPTVANRITIEASPSVSSINDAPHTVAGLISFGNINGTDGWRVSTF